MPIVFEIRNYSDSRQSVRSLFTYDTKADNYGNDKEVVLFGPYKTSSYDKLLEGLRTSSLSIGRLRVEAMHTGTKKVSAIDACRIISEDLLSGDNITRQMLPTIDPYQTRDNIWIFTFIEGEKPFDIVNINGHSTGLIFSVAADTYLRIMLYPLERVTNTIGNTQQEITRVMGQPIPIIEPPKDEIPIAKLPTERSDKKKAIKKKKYPPKKVAVKKK